jgi:ribosomal protein L19
MPRPSMHVGQTLLNHIDSEEKNKIEDSRQFKMPDYRSGDVLEVTMFTSLSEGKFNTFRGVVYSKKQPNNLR